MAYEDHPEMDNQSSHGGGEDIFLFPLSFAQERLWFLYQLDPQGDAYNLPAALRLQGALDWDIFCRSLQELVQRHESLRTTFALEGDQPVQVVSPVGDVQPVVVNLSLLPSDTRDSEVSGYARAEAKRPFDLQQGPLLRVILLELARDEFVLLLTMHHIITDLWSMGILVQELMSFYTSLKNDLPVRLAELPIQYSDFAIWQRQKLQGKVLEEQLHYWREQFSPLPAELLLPLDHPRPPLQSYHGNDYLFKVPQPLTQALHQISEREGVTLFMTLLAAFNVQLYRYTGQTDLVVGSPIANRNRSEIEGLIGFFVNTLALRTRLSGEWTFLKVLEQVSATAFDAYEHQDLPFEVLVEKLQPERDWSRTPLFQVLFALQNVPLGQLELPELTFTPLELDYGTALCDLSLFLEERTDGLVGRLEYNTDLFERSTITRFADHFLNLLQTIVVTPECRLYDLPLLSEKERHQLLSFWNDTETSYPQDTCLHHLVEEQARKTPDAIAVVFEDHQLSYETLNRRADQLGNYLRSLGVGPESIVGICIERSIDMLVGLLGTLKAGGAYLPLDPQYPVERLRFMLHDAQASVVVTQSTLIDLLEDYTGQIVNLDRDWHSIASVTDISRSEGVNADNLAYVIYTSGSTGVPKGVMVKHRNVLNFIAGMDRSLIADPPGTWLAVTSMSFDISVLELFWTLARGFCVVLQGELSVASPSSVADEDIGKDKTLDFSLFYFASEDDKHASENDRYRLLLEGAQFADQHDFSAIWTPERHFHAFGGIYPNPAVIGAALAVLTKHVQIRAGSVVLPLQNPLRVAEEWAVVDNLSRGRVGVSFASGWHANDFVLMPENYADRRAIMERDIDSVRKLWRGEAITCKDGAGSEVTVKTRPSPTQRELPVWLTAAGSPQTFQTAGKKGLRLLTHLLGQSLEELAEKIALYRSAWREHGHPEEGYVTLMIHTFVGEDIEPVRQVVYKPFCDYLRSSVDLLDKLAQSLGYSFGINDFSEDDREALVKHAFERYFETSGLFGTPRSCQHMLQRFKEIGIDEVACLIDFGVETDTILSHLPYLDKLRVLSMQESEQREQEEYTIAAQIKRYAVSHMQCTPSLGRILLSNLDSSRALQGLYQLLLGGEACPVPLAKDLQKLISGSLLNMYGPTETTIWSTTHLLQQEERGTSVLIGRPIANTQIYILDQDFQPVPSGIPGELYIGGHGVTRGYLRRPEVTAERFLPDPFSTQMGACMYKTGDRARFLHTGEIEYLGRTDFQVKLRGFRIELGEIEAVLNSHPSVREAVALVRNSATQENDLASQYQQLIAYITSDPENTVPTEELLRFMEQRLPMYMVPDTIVVLDRLPLTSNGKIDRQALLAHEHARLTEEVAFIAPRHSVEAAVASVWSEVLGIPSVGIQQNFFALGGHSLLATVVIARLRAVFQVDIPLRRLLEEPTVATLAQEIMRLWKSDIETVEEIARMYLQFQQLSDEEAQVQLSS